MSFATSPIRDFAGEVLAPGNAADVRAAGRSPGADANARDGGFLGGLPSDAVAAAMRAAEGRPSQLGSVLLQPMGGAFTRVPEHALPLGRRDAPWHWQAGTAWFESADDGRSRAWVAGVARALTPWSAGETYPNFIPDADPARLRAAYAPAVFERLRAVRAEWDPDDVFAAVHAIPLPAM